MSVVSPSQQRVVRQLHTILDRYKLLMLILEILVRIKEYIDFGLFPCLHVLVMSPTVSASDMPCGRQSLPHHVHQSLNLLTTHLLTGPYRAYL